MRIPVLLLIYFTFSANISFAQSTVIDSLKKELQKSPEDTTALNTLRLLCQEYLESGDNDKLLETARKLGALAGKLAKENSGQAGGKNIKSNKMFQAYSLSYIAAYYLKNADYKEALKNYAVALKLRQEIGDRKGIANIYNNLGMLHQYQADFSEALKYHRAALKVRQEIGDSLGVSASYNSIGSILFEQGNFEESLQNHFNALSIRKEIGDKRYIAESYNNIGADYREQGKLEEAIKNYKLAFDLLQEVGYMQGIVYYYNNIGTAYHLQGKYAEALKMFLTALKLNETLDRRVTADILGNMGDLFSSQRQYNDALKYYRDALKVYSEVGDKSRIAMAYNNIGKIDNEQGNYDQALKNFLFSLKIQNEIGDKKGSVYTYNYIGQVYMNQRNYQQALKSYFASLGMSEAIGAKELSAESFQKIGEIYSLTGNYADAVIALNKAINKADEINYKKVLLLSYASLADVYSRSHNFEKAYEYLKLNNIIKDSLFNTESSKQINEMKTRYETEKKDKEIVLLNKDKELLSKDKEIQTIRIQKQRAALYYVITGFGVLGIFILIYFRQYNQKRKLVFLQQVAEMDAKLLRAQMNPHFIFNSLNSIQSLILENETRLAREYLVTFSRLTRAILEQTRKQSVSLAEEISTLKMYLDLEKLRFNNKFNYTVELKNFTDTENVYLPPLLIQPFIENSVVHGIANKEGKGWITVEFRKEKDALVCIIEDDGIGREKSAEIKQAKEVRNNSVATQLARDRIVGIKRGGDNHTGIFITDLKNEDGNACGTRVEINIPLFT